MEGSIGRQTQGEASAKRGRGRPLLCKPHFFKIIVSSNQYKELYIPQKFVKKYGKGLSNQARLEIPNGVAREVEVVKSGDEIWLRGAWNKFVEDFSIKLGYLLLFRYEGKSCFHVLIFDMSATEIKYPKTKVKKHVKHRHDTIDKEVEIVDTDMEDDDVSVEILEGSPSFSKTEKVQSTQFGECAGRKIRRGGVSVKEAIIRKVEAFRSKSPCFVIVMRPSYISKACGVRIPSFHGRKYLARKVNKSIALHPVGNNEVWRVGYVIVGTLFHLKFTWGWNEFARQNHLKIGDVCMFEMVQGGHNHYRVHIFRDEDD